MLRTFVDAVVVGRGSFFHYFKLLYSPRRPRVSLFLSMKKCCVRVTKATSSTLALFTLCFFLSPEVAEKHPPPPKSRVLSVCWLPSLLGVCLFRCPKSRWTLWRRAKTPSSWRRRLSNPGQAVVRQLNRLEKNRHSALRPTIVIHRVP